MEIYKQRGGKFKHVRAMNVSVNELSASYSLDLRAGLHLEGKERRGEERRGEERTGSISAKAT